MKKEVKNALNDFRKITKNIHFGIDKVLMFGSAVNPIRFSDDDSDVDFFVKISLNFDETKKQIQNLTSTLSRRVIIEDYEAQYSPGLDYIENEIPPLHIVLCKDMKNISPILQKELNHSSIDITDRVIKT